MINKIDLQSFGSDSNEEINLENLFIKLKRNFLLILSIVSLSTIYSIIYASNKEPIYRGQFQILVRDDKDEGNSQTPNLNTTVIPLKLVGNATKQETEKLILKSPLVLGPVYEFTKTEYLKRNENISKLTYKKWIKENLTLEFIDGSDVIELTFQDKDKKLILSTLKMISEKYKIYSKRDHDKNLKRELDYLKNQEKNYIKKYEESFKKYNDFFIENNLYTQNNDTQQITSSNTNLGNSNQSQPRFFDQFNLLEEYEVKRTKYETKLKPNSKLLKALDSQISKLKKSTKKPTKILLQKQNLTKEMLRDQLTLDNLKNQITFTELALAKQKDPWELISTPTVDEQKISPIKKNIVVTFFLVSIFISLILSLLKEVYIGKLDDIDIIKSKFRAKFVNQTPSNLSPINAKLLESNVGDIFSRNNKESKKNAIYFENNSQLITDFINANKYKNLSYLDTLDSNRIEEMSNILIFLKSGKVTYDQINKLNKYVDLYKEINFYWIYLENE